VTDRGKADLVIVLSQKETVAGVMATGSATAAGSTASGSGVAVPITTQNWYLHVIDAKTAEKLWTADTSMGGKLWRTWNSIAQSLVNDIKKRLR
jgi:glucose dehydrogenase